MPSSSWATRAYISGTSGGIRTQHCTGFKPDAIFQLGYGGIFLVPPVGFEPTHKYGLNVKPLPVGLRGHFCGEWQIRTAVPGLTVRSLGPLDELPNYLRLVQDSNLRCCSHGTLTVCCLKPLGQPNIFVGKTGFEPASPWLLTRPLTKRPISVLPVIFLSSLSESNQYLMIQSHQHSTFVRYRCGHMWDSNPSETVQMSRASQLHYTAHNCTPIGSRTRIPGLRIRSPKPLADRSIFQ